MRGVHCQVYWMTEEKRVFKELCSDEHEKQNFDYLIQDLFLWNNKDSKFCEYFCVHVDRGTSLERQLVRLHSFFIRTSLSPFHLMFISPCHCQERCVWPNVTLLVKHAVLFAAKFNVFLPCFGRNTTTFFSFFFFLLTAGVELCVKCRTLSRCAGSHLYSKLTPTASPPNSTRFHFQDI